MTHGIIHSLINLLMLLVVLCMPIIHLDSDSVIKFHYSDFVVGAIK